MKGIRLNKKVVRTVLACAAGATIGIGSYAYYRVIFHSFKKLIINLNTDNKS